MFDKFRRVVGMVVVLLILTGLCGCMIVFRR